MLTPRSHLFATSRHGNKSPEGSLVLLSRSAFHFSTSKNVVRRVMSNTMTHAYDGAKRRWHGMERCGDDVSSVVREPGTSSSRGWGVVVVWLSPWPVCSTPWSSS